MMSRRNYAKQMADPKRSAAAQDGSWKRTINERRIEALRKALREIARMADAQNMQENDGFDQIRDRALVALGEKRGR